MNKYESCIDEKLSRILGKSTGSINNFTSSTDRILDLENENKTLKEQNKILKQRMLDIRAKLDYNYYNIGNLLWITTNLSKNIMI